MKVEFYGTIQKKTCYGCGSMISFDNDDIQEVDNNTFIECPVCGKIIKVHKVDRTNTTRKKLKKADTVIGKKIKEAYKQAGQNEEDIDWSDE